MVKVGFEHDARKNVTGERLVISVYENLSTP